jgi:nitroimidazol reductase NimA-like FMN-containing flavoprotein (pyridoxamine 5'-phosphate oxidase superfamily)
MSRDALEGFEILSTSECISLLQRGCIGRVGFVAGGYPRVLPVNYAAADDGAVVFRTTAASSLTQVALQPVTFEIDGFDAHRHIGWSVCVTGEGREVTDGADPTGERLHRLQLVTWAPGSRSRWFAVLPAEITGRRLPLSATAEELGWIAGVVS